MVMSIRLRTAGLLVSLTYMTAIPRLLALSNVCTRFYINFIKRTSNLMIHAHFKTMYSHVHRNTNTYPQHKCRNHSKTYVELLDSLRNLALLARATDQRVALVPGHVTALGRAVMLHMALLAALHRLARQLLVALEAKLGCLCTGIASLAMETGLEL